MEHIQDEIEDLKLKIRALQTELEFKEMLYGQRLTPKEEDEMEYFEPEKKNELIDGEFKFKLMKGLALLMYLAGLVYVFINGYQFSWEQMTGLEWTWEVICLVVKAVIWPLELIENMNSVAYHL